MKTITLLTVLFLISHFSFSQDGILDSTFSFDGIVITPIGSSADYGYSSAIQTDGKIVVAGRSYNGSNYDFAIVRYNADGSLDNTFDSDGKVETPVGSFDDECYSLAIQSDGKIVLGGRSHNGNDYDFALTRYNSDGSLDNTFDTDGKVVTPIGIAYDGINDLAIQPDGKIVVFGSSSTAVDDVALVRYNPDGSLDNTFGTGGIVVTQVGSFNDSGTSLALQSDGKIVVAASAENGSDYDFAVLRYHADGSLDNTFDSDGKVMTPVGSSHDFGLSVAIQSDEKIIVAGYSYNGTDNDFALVRYNADGSLDNTFDSDGILLTPVGSSDDYGYSLAIQLDGKFIVAGRSHNGSNYDFAAVRYNSDGSLDNTFSTDGKVVTPVGATDDYGYSLAIQLDGKIIVAGASNSGGNYDFAVVRYNGSSGSSPGQITGTITVNGNGLQNVLVKILDEFGLPVNGFDDQYTDANGYYLFADIIAGNYQIMIVEPLGYIVDQNPKLTAAIANETSIINFDLTEIVILNTARSKGYWKHQFDVYVENKGNAQETEQDLYDYIDQIHQHYTIHYNIFLDVNTFEEWQQILSLQGNQPIAVRARQQLAATLLNMVSNKIGQYTVVTNDGRDVGDVVQYVSELILDGNSTNDELAKDLAESVNNQQMIAAGIVPEGSILFKTGINTSEIFMYELSSNFPNPFNPSTNIRFGLPEADNVRLDIFNILGEKVLTLKDEEMPAGYHTIPFDAGSLASGIYIYSLQTNKFSQVKKMLLVK